MAKRKIQVALIVTYKNGDEGIHQVTDLPVPEYLSEIKGSVEKDEELEQHALYLEGWLRGAIAKQIRDDERMDVMDSW